MSVIADRVARMLDAALVAQGVRADDLAEAVTLLEAWAAYGSSRRTSLTSGS